MKLNCAHRVYASCARPRRGSALVMAIVLSVVITAMVMAIAWTAGTQAQSVSSLKNVDSAFFAAEAGAQRVAWYVKNGSIGSLSSPLTGSINGYAYSATWTTVSGSTVRITSTGSLGSVSQTVYQTVTPASAATVVSSGGAFSSTSQLTVTGNLAVLGNVTSSGTFQVTGNINASGSISAGASATGTKTPNDGSVASPPNVTAIYNALAPGGSSIPSGNITTLDFSTNSVLVVNGNATLKVTSVIGTGTLVVNGKVTTGNDVGTAASPLAFNIVSNDDFTATNKFYLTGSVYSGGKITFNNLTAITGVLVATTTITLNNHHSFNMANPPSFDPRSSSLTLTSFAGAQP